MNWPRRRCCGCCSGPYTPGALQRIADEQITPRISAVPGVSAVNVNGGTDFGATVSYDARMLRQLGISPTALSEAIAGARVVAALGIERIGASKREVVLRDQPGAIEELADLPIRGRGNQVFRLGDLAKVRPRGGLARDVLPSERQHRAEFHRDAGAECRRDPDGGGGARGDDRARSAAPRRHQSHHVGRLGRARAAAQ